MELLLNLKEIVCIWLDKVFVICLFELGKFKGLKIVFSDFVGISILVVSVLFWEDIIWDFWMFLIIVFNLIWVVFKFLVGGFLSKFFVFLI